MLPVRMSQFSASVPGARDALSAVRNGNSSFDAHIRERRFGGFVVIDFVSGFLVFKCPARLCRWLDMQKERLGDDVLYYLV
jgi:hypothetical protein